MRITRWRGTAAVTPIVFAADLGRVLGGVAPTTVGGWVTTGSLDAGVSLTVTGNGFDAVLGSNASLKFGFSMPLTNFVQNDVVELIGATKTTLTYTQNAANKVASGSITECDALIGTDFLAVRLKDSNGNVLEVICTKLPTNARHDGNATASLCITGIRNGAYIDNYHMAYGNAGATTPAVVATGNIGRFAGNLNSAAGSYDPVVGAIVHSPDIYTVYSGQGEQIDYSQRILRWPAVLADDDTLSDGSRTWNHMFVGSDGWSRAIIL